MQYGMLLPMGKVFYLSQLAADQKELVSDKICDITLHTNEKPRVEDAYCGVLSDILRVNSAAGAKFLVFLGDF